MYFKYNILQFNKDYTLSRTLKITSETKCFCTDSLDYEAKILHLTYT